MYYDEIMNIKSLINTLLLYDFNPHLDLSVKKQIDIINEAISAYKPDEYKFKDRKLMNDEDRLHFLIVKDCIKSCNFRIVLFNKFVEVYNEFYKKSDN